MTEVTASVKREIARGSYECKVDDPPEGVPEKVIAGVAAGVSVKVGDQVKITMSSQCASVGKITQVS